MVMDNKRLHKWMMILVLADNDQLIAGSVEIDEQIDNLHVLEKHFKA